MASTQSEANAAIFEAIKELAPKVNGSYTNPSAAASVLRDLALAYRYVAGGPQPGGTGAEK